MVVLWRNFALGFASLAALLAGCSSSSSGGDNNNGTGGSTSGPVFDPNKDPDPGPAPGNDLTVTFNPAYSGFDGTRTFKVPAVVQGLQGLKWSSSDPSMVRIEDDPSTGGVLLTTKKAGKVKIIARSGSQSGSTELNIAQYNSADCEAGDMRYNNSVGIDGSPMQAFLGGGVPKNVSCHACHGDGATFFSIQHTPQQLGGWSDEDLINIFTSGFKPDNSAFVSMIPPQIYQRFHQWDATEQEQKGIVCYLRQLAPKAQNAMLDFGGFRPGGMMMPPSTSGAAGAQ